MSTPPPPSLSEPAVEDSADPAVSPDQLAHELNNLLDGSLRSVGLVLRQLDTANLDAPLRDALGRYLGTANESMRQMADVIDRYANAPNPAATPAPSGSALRRFSDKFAPPIARPGQIFRGGGSFREVLRHAVNVYGPTLQASGIRLQTHLEPELEKIPAGAAYTLLANAINNARQAIERAAQPAPEQGHRVAVRIVADADNVLLEVTDTGDGPHPELFDGRGQFRFGVTTRPTGHGVGLSVCRDLAHDLGGELSLAPGDAPNPGLVFALRFPRPHLHAPDPATSTAQTLTSEPGVRRAG